MRDDIVIKPRLNPRQATTPVAERIKGKDRERVAIRKGSRIRKALLLRKGRKVAAAAARRTPGLGTALRLGPTFGAIGTLAVAGAVVRGVTGRDLSGVGQWLNGAILGELDDKARAGLRARQRTLSGPNAAAFAATEEGRDQLAPIFDQIYKRELTIEKGRQAFDADSRFDVPNKLDVLYDRLGQLVEDELAARGFFASTVSYLQTAFASLLIR